MLGETTKAEARRDAGLNSVLIRAALLLIVYLGVTGSGVAGGLVTDKTYEHTTPLKSPIFLSAREFLEHTRGVAWGFYSKLHPGGTFYVDPEAWQIHLHDDDDECLVGKIVPKSSRQFFIDWEDGTRELFEAVIISRNCLRVLPIDQNSNEQLDYIKANKVEHSTLSYCLHAEPISKGLDPLISVEQRGSPLENGAVTCLIFTG